MNFLILKYFLKEKCAALGVYWIIFPITVNKVVYRWDVCSLLGVLPYYVTRK